jgi:hypothetical protein
VVPCFFLNFVTFFCFFPQEEFQRLYTQLEQLKEKNMRMGNRHLAAKISAMQEAARQNYKETTLEPETPSGHSDSDHLKLNNVLAAVTDKIVSASVVTGASGPRSVTLDATNKTVSPQKSKCSSVVSSPDSETPLREGISLTSHRISAENGSKTEESSMERSGRTYSKDSSVTLTSEQKVRCHKDKEFENVSDADVRGGDLEMASACNKSPGDGGSVCRSKSRGNVGKSGHSSGSADGKKRRKHHGEGDTDRRKEKNRYVDREKRESADDGQADAAAAKAAHSQSSSEGASPKNAGSNNRNLKSGHARTHAIIINLDDKNRFTEEVTV